MAIINFYVTNAAGEIIRAGRCNDIDLAGQAIYPGETVAEGTPPLTVPATPAPTVFKFDFAGKHVSADDFARIRMNGITGVVLLTGALPAGWPGSWPADDGSSIPIPDVATWRDFFVAMVAQVV